MLANLLTLHHNPLTGKYRIYINGLRLAQQYLHYDNPDNEDFIGTGITSFDNMQGWAMMTLPFEI